MLLKNNDCDLICKGCELEDDPSKCFSLMVDDLKSIKKESQQMNIDNRGCSMACNKCDSFDRCAKLETK